MKKIFTLIAAMCCTMMTVMASDLADGVDITIGSTAITMANKTDVTDLALTAGTIAYDDVSHTLTFTGVELAGPVVIDAGSLALPITMTFVGENKINVTLADAIWFKAGEGLVITGASDASLNARSQGSGKFSVLYVGKDHSTNNFYPLSISGGMQLHLNNYMADDGYPALACKNLDINATRLTVSGHSGNANKLCYFDGGKNYNNLTNVSELIDLDGYYYFIPCTKKFPIWVDGYQLTDGYYESEGYYQMGSGDYSSLSGAVRYNPETHTVLLDNWFTLDGQNPDADAVLMIWDTEDPAQTYTIKSVSGSPVAIRSTQNGVPALRIDNPTTFDINGQNRGCKNRRCF